MVGQPLGTIANPYNNISNALAAALPGMVVRIVGNGGIDKNPLTLADNLPYEIGKGTLAGQILRFQGDGDYEGVSRFMAERGRLSPTLQQDLARLGSKGIPVDIVFEQGAEVLR